LSLHASSAPYTVGFFHLAGHDNSTDTKCNCKLQHITNLNKTTTEVLRDVYTCHPTQQYLSNGTMTAERNCCI